MAHVKRPGYMKRAVIAWCLLNGIMIAMLAILVYLIGPYVDRWYVMIPLLVAILVSEFVIMTETIAPIIKEWIKQEEYISDGQKPSWDRE
jgi:hypothetical protein